jgi:hypothetical protein
MSDADPIPVCPDCGSGRIKRRVPNKPTSTAAARWHCTECRTFFDTPAERDDRAHPGHGGTLVARLAAADPEEVSADD